MVHTSVNTRIYSLVDSDDVDVLVHECIAHHNTADTTYKRDRSSGKDFRRESNTQTLTKPENKQEKATFMNIIPHCSPPITYPLMPTLT
jgi:hypothetical protein